MDAILFDLDGTLTDPREGITRCIAHALMRMGVAPPPPEELHFAIGPPLRASFARLLNDPGREGIERAMALYRERFTDVGLFENEPYVGIGEALAGLRIAGATLFVATSKPGVYAERIVRHFGLDTHFESIHGCELDGTREDKRELLAHVLEHQGLDPDRTVMVGDRGVDMVAARHHQLRALGVLWGYGSRAELISSGAHDLCESPSSLHAQLISAHR